MRFKKLILSLLLIFLLLPSTIFAVNNNESNPDQFPSTYDLRNLNGNNYVTPVKNQGNFGTCWAFTATSVAETEILLKGGKVIPDLSEKALAWYSFQL